MSYFVLFNTLTRVDDFLTSFSYSKDTSRCRLWVKWQDSTHTNLYTSVPSAFHSHGLKLCFPRFPKQPGFKNYVFIISETVLIWIAKSSFPSMETWVNQWKKILDIFPQDILPRICLTLTATFHCLAATSAIFWSHHSSGWSVAKFVCVQLIKICSKIQAMWAVHIDLWIYLHMENVTFAHNSWGVGARISLGEH